MGHGISCPNRVRFIVLVVLDYIISYKFTLLNRRGTRSFYELRAFDNILGVLSGSKVVILIILFYLKFASDLGR